MNSDYFSLFKQNCNKHSIDVNELTTSKSTSTRTTNNTTTAINIYDKLRQAPTTST